MNNNGTNVYGTYQQESEYGLDRCETCDNLGKSYIVPYDKFTNTLTDEMTVSGVKTWSGFAGYQVAPKDYPTVKIELYRSLDPKIDPLNKKDTDPEFQQWLANGTIEKAAELELRYDEASDTYPTAYSFGTDENPLPKFNGEGQRWSYSVREVIADDIADSLYTERFANGVLTNVFLRDVNRRSIAVTKTWAGRENLLPNEIAKYPSVTFKLYRYVDGQDTANLQPLKTVKIGADQFTGNGTYTYTFEDLLIYSPSGEPYRYYITEEAINGYTISYTDENGIGEGYSDNGRSDVISIPENPFDNTSAHTVAVGTTNTYSDPGKLKITGSKYWNDYGNSALIYGNRPNCIEVTLKRYTQNENGQQNAVSREDISLAPAKDESKPYIEWKVSESDSNLWTYTIYNLERYAPNGMPYIYSVTEMPMAT